MRMTRKQVDGAEMALFAVRRLARNGAEEAGLSMIMDGLATLGAEEALPAAFARTAAAVEAPPPVLDRTIM